jgi:hypothetical protein
MRVEREDGDDGVSYATSLPRVLTSQDEDTLYGPFACVPPRYEQCYEGRRPGALCLWCSLHSNPAFAARTLKSGSCIPNTAAYRIHCDTAYSTACIPVLAEYKITA